MERERTFDKVKKLIGPVLIAVWFLIFVMSCSTGRSILKWTGIWDQGEKNSGAREDEFTQFFAGVRPAQGRADSHYLLACYYQERGQHREAIEGFKKVLSIDPAHVKAYNGMGVSYDLIGDFPKAVESYRNALKLKPDLEYIHNNLGYSYLLQGNVDEAVAAFRNAVALSPGEKRFHNNLGLAYGEKGDFDRALIEFGLAGDWVRAHYNIAQLYYKKGIYHKAVSHYTMALELDPSATIVQSGLEAARALARIFQPGSNPADEKELMVPDRVMVVEIETKALITPHEIDRIKQPSILKDAGVEVSNGNGVNRMARRVGNYLKERGLKVIRLTNADHFNYPGTKIYYFRGYDETADHLAEQLPIFHDIQEVKGFDRQNIRIKLLIGKDLVPQKQLFMTKGG